MTMNDGIVHNDLMNLGIFFLEKAEERAFLKRVNDEFAYLVGLEALNQINENDNRTGGIALEDIWRFLEKDQEKCKKIVKTVRARILLTLKERRKFLLGGSGKQETCFTQGDSGDDIEVSL